MNLEKMGADREKLIKVVTSCKNIDQLKSAYNMWMLFEKKWFMGGLEYMTLCISTQNELIGIYKAKFNELGITNNSLVAS